MNEVKKRPKCPKCKSENTLVIVYGLVVPEEAAMKLKESGGYWGGCIPDSSKKWHCDSCQHEWGKVNNQG